MLLNDVSAAADSFLHGLQLLNELVVGVDQGKLLNLEQYVFGFLAELAAVLADHVSDLVLERLR